MKKVIIFGNLDTAQLAYYYLTTDYNYNYEIIGFTLNREFIKETYFEGLPVIPFEDIEKTYPPKDYLLFAPIAKNNLREKIYNEGKEKGYNFITYISSKCTNFSEYIGENCFILEDNTLQPFTKIGNNVILWSGNHIGHHGIIKDHVFFTSHIVMSGHCLINEGAWIGVNTTIRDFITIGKNSIIGMGSLITKNIPDNETWYGSPAKKIK